MRGRPDNGKGKANERKQHGKAKKRQGLAVVNGKYVSFHGHDAVDIDLGIDKLEKQAGKESAAGRNFFYLSSAFYGFPGQVQHIGSS